jgi:hypothetical protein
LLLEDHFVYVLIDPGAIHFFVERKIKNKLKKQPFKLEKRFLIITPLGDVVVVEHVYRGVKITIEGYDIEVDVMPLELHDFDVILRMDWLSNHRAQMDCFTKTVTLRGIRWEMSDFFGGDIPLPIV